MIPQFTRISVFAVLALAGTLPSHGQTIPEIPTEIVSAWKLNGGDALLIFRHDGVYFQVQDDPNQPGMERGTFTWDKTTSAFSATTLRDTNRESGLSHPSGATTLAVSGNTLTYTAAGEGSFTFSRVVNTASAIVGSWFLSGESATLTFLADGTYYHCEESNDVPDGYDGMERGTYVWNPSTSTLTATPLTDTNGWSGLSDPEPAFTANIAGNSMSLFDGEETYILRRITQISAPLDLDWDFEVLKYSNHRQTSTASPSLLPFPPQLEGDELPFRGLAYIEDSVPDTGGSLTITGQVARPFDSDPFDNGWYTSNEYGSLAQLDALTAFPSGATYTFARTGGSASLTYPANGAFLAAPKVVGTDEHGTWSGGEYFLGQDSTLIWDAHTAYDPTTLLTALTVVRLDEFETVLEGDIIQGDITSYDFSGRLTPGGSYYVRLEHIKIASTTTSGTGPFAGKLGYASYISATEFTMVAPAVPASEPTISLQPISQLPAEAAKVILTIGTNDEDPTLNYQWFKNSEPIPGQTGNNLYIEDYSTAADSGTYRVEVSNAAGSVTSELATLGSAVVEFVIVGKEIFYRQTDSSTVILDPSPVTPDNGGPFGFIANVEGQNMSLIAAPTVTPPAGTPGPVNNPFENTLYFNDEDLGWRYGPNANDWGTLTQPETDTAFPNGTYAFLVNGVSVPLSLTGDAYPNTPQLSLSGGVWVNGKYAMDAANALTVTTNIFTGYGTNVDGHLRLDVGDSSVEFFKSSSPTTDFATYSAAPNTLSPNEILEVDAGFDAITSKSNAIPGAYCAAVYSKNVDLEIHFLPKIITQPASQVLEPLASITLQVSATGSPAAGSESMNYQWKKNGVAIPGLTSPSFGLIDFSADDAGTYTCVVSNDVGSATTQPVHLEFADAFQSYAASFGLNSVTTGAPDADHDKDGIPNLLEYLLGGNPTLPGSGLLPTITKAPGSSNLVFTYKRKIAATGVTQVIEHAASLSSTWSTAVHGQNGVTIATATVPGDATTEHVTVTIPSPSTSRFVRLKASR